MPIKQLLIALAAVTNLLLALAEKTVENFITAMQGVIQKSSGK